MPEDSSAAYKYGEKDLHLHFHALQSRFFFDDATMEVKFGPDHMADKLTYFHLHFVENPQFCMDDQKLQVHLSCCYTMQQSRPISG